MTVIQRLQLRMHPSLPTVDKLSMISITLDSNNVQRIKRNFFVHITHGSAQFPLNWNENIVWLKIGI